MAWEPQNSEFPQPHMAIETEGLTHQQILSNREALERKLQLRRPREQLINQGIMPAAMAAPSILSQKSKLERAQTGDLLQRKIRVRPNRQQLVQRHILNDTSAGVDPSLIAKQIKLKRKKLEDDLNDKLLIRPGPLELVKENILEVGTKVGQAVKEGEVDFTDVSNSALLQPISPESEGSPVPSPDTTGQIQLPTGLSTVETTGHNSVLEAVSQLHQLSEGTFSDSQGFTGKKESRPRKKPSKPKFKKYKYHEYRPPNGEVEKSSLPMDSPYALLLQQQQLYLQLQVLYQNYPYQFAGLPSIPENKSQNINNNNEQEKPVKIEDMRVVDMRKELKMRGLPVSGSKTDLIERLKASSTEPVVTSDILVANSPGSPTVMVTSNSVMSSVPVTSMATTVLSNNGHNQLMRSNSLPVDNNAQNFQQLQIQLMANNQKLQQYPSLPVELQQQLQQLQYLNLQMQLQKLNVQPQSQNVGQEVGSMPQTLILGGQPSTIVKQEPQLSECSFSQQQSLPFDVQQFSSASVVNAAVAQQAPHVSVAQLGLQANNTTSQQSQLASRSLDDMSHQSHPSSQMSPGLMLLQAEASRLNTSPSNSEQDLSQLENDNAMGWGKGGNKRLPCTHGAPSPTNVFMTTTQAGTIDMGSFSKPKTDQQVQRSYSSSERDGNGLIPEVALEISKPRSNSEPPQPLTHKKSLSVPSTGFFLEHPQPPPSYEAHMAAQMQRKLSHDYPQQQLQQQQQTVVKTEDMDIPMDKEIDFTQELQRAMLKQEVGLDHDEILEILGAKTVPHQEPKIQTTLGNQMTLNNMVPSRATPHNLSVSPNQHPHHHSPVIPKSPSTGFLGGFHPSPTNSFTGRLSKSCEDVTGVQNMNNKNNLQSCNDGSFPDFDAMMSPGSPMKLDSDTDYQGLMMHSNSIPIPGTKNESLNWLDLNSSPVMTSLSPGTSTEVSYSSRGTPPLTLYETSPSLTSEHFPMSLFELDVTGNNTMVHDFSEAMDFCV